MIRALQSITASARRAAGCTALRPAAHGGGALLLIVALTGAAAPAAAQEWRLGTQLGRLTWPGAAAASAQQSSIAVTLTRSGISDWLGISAGAPVGGGAPWATAALATRLATSGRIGAGLDLSGHGFLQRVEVEPAGPAPSLPLSPATKSEMDVLGGGGGQAMLVGFARIRDLRLEVRGGAAAQAVAGGSFDEQSVVPAADARALLQVGPIQLGAEAQHWAERADWLGASARFGAGLLDGWANAGRWSGAGAEGLAWSAGVGLALPGGLRLDASYSRNSHDPLYGTTAATAASVGVSLRLAGGSAHRPPVPAAYVEGVAVIRLPAREAPATPLVAGDFTQWKPVAMTRDGDAWTLRIPLEPGVYNYSFVTDAGEWFVPETTPGRRSDGMGGWVAVLVVSP